MNILLCGLPGCGKTTVGKMLAEKLQGEFVDTDSAIENAYKLTTGEALSCRQIFSQKGEPFFRRLEHQVIMDLIQKPLRNTVISIGGGVNIQQLKGFEMTVYLKADPKDLFQRINRNGLPAYLDPKDPFGSFEKLIQQRTPHFIEAADIQIDGDNLTPEEIVTMVLDKIPKKLNGKYPIYIGQGLLQSSNLITTLQSFNCSQYVIITDTVIEAMHGKPLDAFLKSKGFPVSLVSFPAGEAYKTRETKEFCENHLLKLGAGRDTCIIALGGGVVLDIAGFVASTYCRGVPCVMIPTSLLAMVDASIGGKTGVNVPEGKNLIGTVYRPNAVFMDTHTLKTLPLDEIKNGISEMIKHGIIADVEYFIFLKKHAKKLLKLDFPLLEKAIYDSVAIKTTIVEQDETEHGKRRLLNFGHTVAHAIETATNYEIPHGKAVAIGIITESYVSMQMGHLPQSEFNQILQIFDDFAIDTTWKTTFSFAQLYEIMRMDKKSIGKKPRIVILENIGKPLEFNQKFCTEIDESLLKNALERR